jgi:deazaflavin-dependent oxidoreductase (nitroreductase family)
MTKSTQHPAAGTGSPPPVWAIKAMTRTHKILRALSGGLLFNSFAGYEVCFVEMTGAKSGRTLSVPLMYVPYEQGVLLVASQGGNPRNPVWSHNLIKHPDIVVEYHGQRTAMTARLASADEKPALWPICDKHYPPYADYRTYTTRDIPVFVCEPAGEVRS